MLNNPKNFGITTPLVLLIGIGLVFGGTALSSVAVDQYDTNPQNPFYSLERVGESIKKPFLNGFQWHHDRGEERTREFLRMVIENESENYIDLLTDAQKRYSDAIRFVRDNQQKGTLEDTLDKNEEILNNVGGEVPPKTEVFVELSKGYNIHNKIILDNLDFSGGQLASDNRGLLDESLSSAESKYRENIDYLKNSMELGILSPENALEKAQKYVEDIKRLDPSYGKKFLGILKSGDQSKEENYIFVSPKNKVYALFGYEGSLENFENKTVEITGKVDKDGRLEAHFIEIKRENYSLFKEKAGSHFYDSFGAFARGENWANDSFDLSYNISYPIRYLYYYPGIENSVRISENVRKRPSGFLLDYEGPILFSEENDESPLFGREFKGWMVRNENVYFKFGTDPENFGEVETDSDFKLGPPAGFDPNLPFVGNLFGEIDTGGDWERNKRRYLNTDDGREKVWEQTRHEVNRWMNVVPYYPYEYVENFSSVSLYSDSLVFRLDLENFPEWMMDENTVGGSIFVGLESEFGSDSFGVADVTLEQEVLIGDNLYGIRFSMVYEKVLENSNLVSFSLPE